MVRNDDNVDTSALSLRAATPTDRLFCTIHILQHIYYIPGIRKSVLIRVNNNGWPLSSLS